MVEYTKQSSKKRNKVPIVNHQRECFVLLQVGKDDLMESENPPNKRRKSHEKDGHPPRSELACCPKNKEEKEEKSENCIATESDHKKRVNGAPYFICEHPK